MEDLQKSTIAAIINVFETGRVRGDYGAIAVMKGDSGHLSYGRSQVSLGSGKLSELLAIYCKQPTALFASALQPHLPRFQRRDFSLDQDQDVQSILRRAGREDPIMRFTQDQFFNANYLAPALDYAARTGISSALGNAVVYDSCVQGGWARLSQPLGKVAGPQKESEWIARYVDARKHWLLSLHSPLPGTVYRMDAFSSIMKSQNWTLTLPIVVHGVTVTEDLLAGPEPTITGTARTLAVRSPYLRGDDVLALQRALKNNQLENGCDGVYGPFTDALVTKYKAAHGIQETGVGPLTRKALGLT